MYKRYRARIVGFLLCFVPVFVSPANIPGERAPPTRENVQSRMELVREIKAYEARLGWKPTKNFEQYNERLVAYPYCIQSGKLDFDSSWSSRTKEECSALVGEYDTVFYEFEALATIETPLSRSMVEASLPRFIMVVFHEDYHEQLTEIPSRALDESATMLVGLLTARDFALEKYGANSAIYRALAADVETTLSTSHIESNYYKKLESLYAEVKNGNIDRREGLIEKAKLFEKMQNTCRGMRLATAISCVELTNNAIFGNSIDYSKHYPLFYELHVCLGKDVRQTGLLIAWFADKELTEKEFLHRVNGLIENNCSW